MDRLQKLESTLWLVSLSLERAIESGAGKLDLERLKREVDSALMSPRERDDAIAEDEAFNAIEAQEEIVIVKDIS